MSNVFKYPNNEETHYINPEDSILLGSLRRAKDFLDGGNNANEPYMAGYIGGTQRMAGLPTRTPEQALKHVSRFRGYYGVASGLGLQGYPTYESIYRMPAIFCYFHLIKFNVTDAYPNPVTGTLTLECRRNHGGSHPTSVPFFETTFTHGMGNSTFKYTDNIPARTGLFFEFSGFNMSIPDQWGNFLNSGQNGIIQDGFAVKVIDAQKLEIYYDNARNQPVDIGPNGLDWDPYPGGGFGVIAQGQDGAFQLLSAKFYDKGNLFMTSYDKDYYSGAGNSVNNDFGADIVGARPSFYVSSSTTSTTGFLANAVVDFDLYPGTWQFDSDFLPDLKILCAGDGLPFNNPQGSTTNGTIVGVDFNVELAGLFNAGGLGQSPFAAFSQCLVLPANNPSDDRPGSASISAITQASPAVVTFANSVRDFTAQFTSDSRTFSDIVGMTQLNGKFVFTKHTSHNTAELYEDVALTIPVDSTGFDAYVSGGIMQVFDHDRFRVFSDTSYLGRDFMFGPSGQDRYQKFAPGALDLDNFGASADQFWPRTVSPAKIDMTLLHPTRKTYAQDLTRYTNSTGAYGYRLSVTYNNISVEAWREFDSFIKQMRGASAPFIFRYVNNPDGGGYNIFDTNQATVDTWAAARPVLAKQLNPGDTSIFMTGFRADGSAPGTNTRIVSRTGDVFFGVHSYRTNFTANNVGFAGGEFETNPFGEAVIRFTHPLKQTVPTLGGGLAGGARFLPTKAFNYFQCMLSDDEVEFDWHPTGKFVSFTVNMDVV
jgi:hypothetical protein